MALELQVLRSFPDCEALREDFDRLLSEVPGATPFHTFEWMKANLVSFENSGVYVLSFRQDDSTLVGVVPLVVRRGRRYLRAIRWLEFAGQPHADYGGSLIRPGSEFAVAERLLEYLDTNKALWDGVHLEKMMPGDPFSQALLSVAHKKHVPMAACETYRVWRLAKHAHLTSQGGSRSLDRAIKRLSGRGPVHFEVHSSPGEIERRLDAFFHLHAARFLAKGLHSPLADSKHQEFYRNIVRELAPRRCLWLSTLACGDLPVAMRFSLRRGDTLHLYSTCFAQEFARYSPSMLQLRMLLDYAFSDGIEVVDFGIGESPHKEQPGAALQQALLEIELYSGRIARLESGLCRAAQRAQSHSKSLQRAGKLLRRFFPYKM